MILVTIQMNNGHNIQTQLDPVNWELFINNYTEYLAGTGSKKVHALINSNSTVVYIPFHTISYFVREYTDS